MKRLNWWLVGIILLGAILRLNWLDQYPVGVSGDEIQQAYSAYSISQTGRDEWGEWLPLFPRGFGDYKPPLLMYLMVPWVGLLGLNEWSMRLPTAVVGIALIGAVYGLTKQLFDDRKIALSASLLMSISPWGIQLSRTAFEGGLGVLLLALGVWSLFKIKQSIWWLILAIISWSLSLYSYHAFKVIVPICLAGLWLINWRVWPIKRMMLVVIVAGIISLPILMNSSKTSRRLADVGIFNVMDSEELRYRKMESPSAQSLGRIFDGRYVYLGEKMFDSYLQYWSVPVFFAGSRPDSNYLNFPTTPLLYPVEIFSFGFGLWWLISRYRRVGLILGLLIFTAPLAAALAHGGIAVNRAVSFLPWLVIISGLGLAKIIELMSKWPLKPSLVKLGIGVVLGFSLVQFGYYYFYHLPYLKTERQRWAVSQSFQQLVSRSENYDSVVVSHSFGQPQMWVAFYNQWDPRDVQRYSQDWLRYETEGKLYVDQLGEYRLGKYQFRDLAWNDLRLQPSNLVAGSVGDFPANVVTVWTVDDNRGNILYKLVETEANKELIK